MRVPYCYNGAMRRARYVISSAPRRVRRCLNSEMACETENDEISLESLRG
jgi:hypothetical protein